MDSFGLAGNGTLPEGAPYRLHAVSVVVTAEFHNPSILNPDFLASRGIVPADWETTEAVTTPPVSIVRYSNGIQWIVEQSKLTVNEVCESPFRDDYRVYELVKAYLSKLPQVPYRSLGLNCAVSMRQEDPGRWLTQRFLKPGAWLKGKPEIVGLKPNFAMDAGDATCNLTLSDGDVQQLEDGSERAILITVNVHHDGPLDVDRLRMAIDRWPERQAFAISALDKLLRNPQT